MPFFLNNISTSFVLAFEGNPTTSGRILNYLFDKYYNTAGQMSDLERAIQTIQQLPSEEKEFEKKILILSNLLMKFSQRK